MSGGDANEISSQTQVWGLAEVFAADVEAEVKLGGFDFALLAPVLDGTLPRGEASDYAAPEVRGARRTLQSAP